MSTDDPRVPEYDPEADGLPDMVDPDSNAFDEDESVREADGLESGLWPDDRPVALDGYGTTAREAHDGMPLDDRLAREEPDIGAEEFGSPLDDVPAVASDRDEFDDEADPDAIADPYAEDEAEDAEIFAGGLEEDDPVDRYAEETPVGRFAEPDSDPSGGRHNRLYAEDEGMAGGGFNAEEAAMHVVDEDEDAEGEEYR
jgi:hypothetical protein